MPLSPAKSYYWNVFLRICNNFSEQNCLDKSLFNNVSILNHSSPMNNTVTNNIKHFLELFALGPQIDLKRRWHYFLFWSIITTKLDIYVYKYKDDYIFKSLSQAVCLTTINVSLNKLLEIELLLAWDFKLFISPCSHHLLIPVSIFQGLLVPAPISGNFPDTKMITDFYLCQITLNL